MRYSSESGSVNPLLISSILLGLLAAGLAGLSVWAYANYMDQKNNTDAKIAAAVQKAEKVQEEKLEASFIEREKQPYVKFSGPDDLGHVSFDYPKTWSVYIGKIDGSSYEAYLNPGTVPTVKQTQPYAVRVVIDKRQYEAVLKQYESLVKTGKLTSVPITAGGFTGVRLDGAFTPQRVGTTVVFKVRDKTLLISSDSTSFKSDFDNIILKSLDFNP